MKTSEVLNKAADLIEEKGWAQGGAGYGPAGQVCVINACCEATGDIPSQWMPATDRVKAHIGITHSLDLWNDNPGRTAAEVVEVLRAAAVIEAARETPAGIFRMGDITATIPAQVTA